MRILIFIILSTVVSFSSFGQSKSTKEKTSQSILTARHNSSEKGIDTITIAGRVKLDTLLINSIKPSQNIEQKSETSWVKTYLPSIIALFVLFVTNLVVLIKIRLESKEALKREITLTSIKLDKERLELFYDPIFTTLSTNEDIYNSFGPNTFPEDDALRNEASIVWRNMINNIILPNNELIIKVITNKSHLIVKEDNINSYLEFLKHAQSFSHFVKFPNSIHKGYKYNPQFKEHIKNQRENIINKLEGLEKKLK